MDRQRIIPGFDQDAFSHLTAVAVGLGGLNGEVVSAIAKGALARRIVGIDPDIASRPDLSRQQLRERDLGRPKARAVPQNVVRHAVAPLDIVAYALRFEDAVDQGVDLTGDVAIVGVDNNPARVAASTYFRRKGIPVIVHALSADADMGYVFVQEHVGPCWGCLFPDAVTDTRQYPCAPSCGDLVKTVAGVATYALTSLFTRRARHWNYYEVNLAGPGASRTATIPCRLTCPLCPTTQH